MRELRQANEILRKASAYFAQAEFIHQQPWKNRKAVELATLSWVDWFNHRRLLAPIGNVPPAEAEAIYSQPLTEPALAA